jgi:hypothetical protein
MSLALSLEGGLRLSQAEEIALNLLIREQGGEHEGMPLFKLEWAADSNMGRKVPICFHPLQFSYHILVWEPPSPMLTSFARELGEDTSKGTYSCVTHFVDDKDQPFPPTKFVMEHILPILKRAQETAKAALMGEKAIVERNRRERKTRLLAEEKAKERAYDSYAESLLNDSKPAFDGNPMSTSKHSSGIVLTDLERSKPNADVPEKFDFTIRPKRNG